MCMGHMGYGIGGLNRIRKPGDLWSMAPKNAKRRLRILRFWDKHALAATVEAFEVSHESFLPSEEEASRGS